MLSCCSIYTSSKSTTRVIDKTFYLQTLQTDRGKCQGQVVEGTRHMQRSVLKMMSDFDYHTVLICLHTVIKTNCVSFEQLKATAIKSLDQWLF